MSELMTRLNGFYPSLFTHSTESGKYFLGLKVFGAHHMVCVVYKILGLSLINDGPLSGHVIIAAGPG